MVLRPHTTRSAVQHGATGTGKASVGTDLQAEDEDRTQRTAHEVSGCYWVA